MPCPFSPNKHHPDYCAQRDVKPNTIIASIQLLVNFLFAGFNFIYTCIYNTYNICESYTITSAVKMNMNLSIHKSKYHSGNRSFSWKINSIWNILACFQYDHMQNISMCLHFCIYVYHYYLKDKPTYFAVSKTLSIFLINS